MSVIATSVPRSPAPRRPVWHHAPVREPEVRAGRAGEFEAYARAISVAFGEEFRADDTASWHARLGDRFHVAVDDGTIVGGAAAFAFRLTIPGGEIPVAGVTGVGIQPTHRRQGLLRRLMAAQLQDTRERGEPVAILWASEAPIYGHFGYGLALIDGSFELARSRAVFREPVAPSGRFRLLEPAEARRRLPPFYERLRTERPGMWARNDVWWEAILADPGHARQGGGPRYVAVHELDGQVDAYAQYRLHEDWDASGPHNRLRVHEWLADGSEATRQIWAYLLGVDLVGTIIGRFEPLDHPLLLLLADPRALRLTAHDALWLRIVDVAAALEERGYATADRLVLEIDDRFMADVAGRWVLDTTGDRARVERTDEPADLRLASADLASAYLGAISFHELAEAGLAVAAPAAPAGADAPSALDRADALFRTPVRPRTLHVF
jgi:predicted acetyltransferase